MRTAVDISGKDKEVTANRQCSRNAKHVHVGLQKWKHSWQHVLPAAGLATRWGLNVHSSYSRDSGSLGQTVQHIGHTNVRTGQ
jgi:hypothetical protein